MSWRIWLGDDKKEWADTNLCEYNGSMSDLVQDATVIFANPRRICSPTVERLNFFFELLQLYWKRGPEKYSQILIGDESGWSEPTTEDFAQWTIGDGVSHA